MDGVIVNTVELHYRSWQKTLDDFGIPFSRAFNQTLRGLNRRKSIEKILLANELDLNAQKQDEIFIKKNIEYLELIQHANSSILSSIVLPGVLDLIHDLAKNNIPIAVASSSRNAKIILEQLKIDHHFDTIIDGTDIQVSKPNPAVFIEASNYLQANPQNLVVIEDSSEGIKAAIESGFTPIGVGDHFTTKQENITYIDSLEGITFQDLNHFHHTWNVKIESDIQNQKHP